VSEVHTRFNLDESDSKIVVRRVQDVEPVLDRAKALHNEGLHGSSDYKHAASIPNVIVERYCNLSGITFAEFMANDEHIRRLLNDPDLSHFRIWPGRI
jgi:hypothetical protein